MKDDGTRAGTISLQLFKPRDSKSNFFAFVSYKHYRIDIAGTDMLPTLVKICGMDGYRKVCLIRENDNYLALIFAINPIGVFTTDFGSAAPEVQAQ